MKKIPVLYEKKEFCSGCTACYAVCPKNAIDMKADEEGFLYPVISEEKCVSCQKCISICPIQRKIAELPKTIGIVTLYGNNNIGNKLQNFAVQEILKQRGLAPKTIVSEVEKELPFFSLIRLKICIKNTMAKMGIRSGNLKYYALDMERERRFEKFSDKYLDLGEKVNVHSLPENLGSAYDYFVTGSDQVWHNWTDTVEELKFFFLQFANPHKRLCISPSFGFNQVPDSYEKYYKDGLSEFSHLSCREESGVDLIEKLTGKSAQLLIDPTMMLTKQDWEKIAKKPKTAISENYLLVYLLGNESARTREIIKEIALSNQLQVVDVLDKNTDFYLSTPDEFLGLLQSANLVCTDSFHGCVFSILFEKQFICFERNGSNAENMENRLKTLLKKYHLEHRFYRNLSKEHLFETSFEEAQQILEVEREKFEKYLDNIFADNDTCNNLEKT